jgi:hypothetical protein
MFNLSTANGEDRPDPILNFDEYIQLIVMDCDRVAAPMDMNDRMRLTSESNAQFHLIRANTLHSDNLELLLL